MKPKNKRPYPKAGYATLEDIPAIITRFGNCTVTWDDTDLGEQKECAIDALTLLPIYSILRDVLVAKGAEIIGTASGPAIRMLDGRIFTGIADGKYGPELVEQSDMFPEIIREKKVWGQHFDE